jgi:hypothetical protein
VDENSENAAVKPGGNAGRSGARDRRQPLNRGPDLTGEAAPRQINTGYSVNGSFAEYVFVVSLSVLRFVAEA